jgi:protein phosphatase
VKLSIPDPSLVVLVGATGSGKSTFARRHFRPTEILSSDAFRAMLRDDENDQAATADAFRVLHLVAAKRLEADRTAVIDATNVRADARRPLLALAHRAHVDAVAIVLDVPAATLRERLAARGDRAFDASVVERHLDHLRRSLRGLRAEGFREVHVVSTEDVDRIELCRRRPPEDRRWDPGPFDIVGDVHGCLDELRALLARLGYDVGADLSVRPPPGRRALFLGDLVDRGPAIPAVLRLAMGMVRAGTALCLPGNHEEKLLRWLAGRNVQVGTGLAASIEQLSREPAPFRTEVRAFLAGLVPHLVLDGGRLVVAHAGLRRALQGRDAPAARAFALYGDPTGALDEHGLPIRRDWARDYRGPAVVYGHTPVDEPAWVNGTICVDTGCVFGGRLTALRWPERELVAVPAARAYASRPAATARP